MEVQSNNLVEVELKCNSYGKLYKIYLKQRAIK